MQTLETVHAIEIQDIHNPSKVWVIIKDKEEFQVNQKINGKLFYETFRPISKKSLFEIDLQDLEEKLEEIEKMEREEIKKMSSLSIIKKLSKEIMFEFDKNKKLGHLRCQFGWQKQIANQFIPTEEFHNRAKTNQINTQRIQEIVNVIQFDYLKNYEIMEELTDGNETDFFMQDDNINYWIRLNMLGTSEYNVYIHCYHQ